MLIVLTADVRVGAALSQAQIYDASSQPPSSSSNSKALGSQSLALVIRPGNRGLCGSTPVNVTLAQPRPAGKAINDQSPKFVAASSTLPAC